jgi:hypothetical protein
LRRAAFSVYQSNGGNWGMALFIRQGMVGWMRAWPKRDVPPDTEKYQPAVVIATPTSVPASLRNQITILLANMVLNGQKEVAL